jgi:hypothetical protein
MNELLDQMMGGGLVTLEKVKVAITVPGRKPPRDWRLRNWRLRKMIRRGELRESPL